MTIRAEDDPATSFDERILAYAATARYRRRPGAPALFAISNGDTNWEIDEVGNQFQLTKQDRGAEKHVLVSSDDLEVIRKYLTIQLAVDVRHAMRWGRFELPSGEADLPHGFVLDTTATGTVLSWASEGRAHSARFAPSDRKPAIRFAYYADAPLEHIERAAADPAGSPVFTKP